MANGLRTVCEWCTGVECESCHQGGGSSAVAASENRESQAASLKLKDLWIHHYVVLRDTNGEVIRDKNGCARPVYAIGDDEFPPKDLPAGLKGALVPL